MLALPRTRTLRHPRGRPGLVVGAAALLVTVALVAGGAPTPSGWARGAAEPVPSAGSTVLLPSAGGVSGPAANAAGAGLYPLLTP